MWITLRRANDNKPDSPVDVNFDHVSHFEPRHSFAEGRPVVGSDVTLGDDDAAIIRVVEVPSQIRSLIAAAKAGAA